MFDVGGDECQVVLETVAPIGASAKRMPQGNHQNSPQVVINGSRPSPTFLLPPNAYFAPYVSIYPAGPLGALDSPQLCFATSRSNNPNYGRNIALGGGVAFGVTTIVVANIIGFPAVPALEGGGLLMAAL